jgi:anti-sigma B factor antagonist
MVNSTSIQGDFGVQVIRSDSQYIVEVAGQVTINSSPQLRLVLLQLIEHSPGSVVMVDFSNVPYLDSSGIATLLEVLKAAREKSVKLRLVGAVDRVRMLIELLELPKIFSAFGSEVAFP